MKCAFSERAHLQSTCRSGAEGLVVEEGAGGGGGGWWWRRGVGCPDGIDAEFKGTEVSGLKDPSQQGETTSSPGGAPRGGGSICVTLHVHPSSSPGNGKIPAWCQGGNRGAAWACVAHISPHDCSCVPARRSEPP